MIGGFQFGPFQTNYQQVLPSVEIGIGLAPVARPVDFVIQSPLWRQGFVTVRLPVAKKNPNQEESELKEMMQLYALWKRAA